MSRRRAKKTDNRRAYQLLLATAAILASCFGFIAWISPAFSFHSPLAQRPIITVITLFAVAQAAYLVAVATAVRLSSSPSLIAWIFGASFLFRMILWPSTPIQEIDIYRYLWDGAVLAEGISPFRYAPDEIKLAAASQVSDPGLHKLIKLREDDQPLGEILNRIHYGQLPTVYPPVSQVIFAVGALVVPAGASLTARMSVMKLGFLAFDFGTLWLLVQLLRHLALPVGWSVAYGWCPLVMKEFANSGHLDAIAVFFTTLGISLIVRQVGSVKIWKSVYAAAAIAAGIGAKLYPVVLVPLLTVWLIKQNGIFRALTFALATALLSALFLAPMFAAGTSTPASVEPKLPQAAALAARQTDSAEGLRTFLTHWEMNDFFFLFLIENIKPLEQVQAMGKEAWFSFVPDRYRQLAVGYVASEYGLEPRVVPFWIARGITLTASAGVALLLAIFAWQANKTAAWLEAAFLTIAWFWLLSPTLNPWYWTWALPLVMFGRSRVWMWMSGLVLLYYLRFWLEYQWPDQSVLGTPYVGVQFFDFIVTWIEFFPWLIALLSTWWLARRRTGSEPAVLSS